MEVESIKLFVRRAKESNPDYSPSSLDLDYIAGICNYVEGNPLAIALCASRIKLYTAKEITNRLNEVLGFRARNIDIASKHISLFDAINRSFETLSEEEKSIFLQTSVFRNGFTLDAALTILEVPANSSKSVEEVIESLLDHHLLRLEVNNSGRRFKLYVTIKDFVDSQAKEKLSPTELYRLRKNWAEFYIEYMQGLSKSIHEKNAKQALDEIMEEMENIFEIQEVFLKEEPEIATRGILAFSKTMAIRGPAIIEQTN